LSVSQKKTLKHNNIGTEPANTKQVFPQLLELGINRSIYRNVVINRFISEYPESDFHALAKKVYDPLTLSRAQPVDLSRTQLSKLKIAPINLSSICGTVFSDASILKNGTNYRLGIRQSTRQTDWFLWKALYVCKSYIKSSSTNIVYPKSLWEQNTPFCKKSSAYLQKSVDSTGLAINQIIVTNINVGKPDGFQQKSLLQSDEFLLGKWHLQTLNHPTLTNLHTILYKGRKKIIQRFWLNHMNNFFLMTLWLDDGSLVGHRHGSICWNNTPLDEANIFVQYLKTLWDIDCSAKYDPSRSTLTNPDFVVIKIKDIENLEKLCSIVAPIIPVKCMLYKVCLYHVSSSNRQRWTSTLKTLIRPDWHSEIDNIYTKLDAASSTLDPACSHRTLVPRIPFGAPPGS
jgi:hypothetical protein